MGSSSTKPSPASSAQFKSTIDIPALNPEEFMESPKVDYLGTFDQALSAAKNHGVEEFGWNGNTFNTNASELKPMSRVEALKAFMANKGGTRTQARNAYRSAKMAFDNNNMSGDRNEWARRMIARSADNTPDQILPDESTRAANSLALARMNETPVDMFKRLHGTAPAAQAASNVRITNTPVMEQPVEENVPGVDNFSFNDTFAAARRAGLKEFGWRGKRYNTNLASSEQLYPIIQTPTQTNQQILQETPNPMLKSRLNDPYYDPYRGEAALNALKTILFKRR